MTYYIAEEPFRTKAAVTDRCRQIIALTPDGCSVAASDLPFLFGLFAFHDEWPEKSRPGVRAVATQTTVQGTRCFVLERIDGSQIDISFAHAIRCLPTTRVRTPQALRDFRDAARRAIAHKTRAFRDSTFREGLACPITGATLVAADTHVDHEPPLTFDVLLHDFCRSSGIDPLSVAIGSSGGTVAVIEDAAILAGWRAYHAEHAKLRLVSAIGNLQLPKVSVDWASL